MNKRWIKAVKSQIVLLVSMVGLFQSLLVCCGQEENRESKKITFSEHIRPIFDKSCLRCHSGKLFFFGGLRLNSLKWIQKGGHSGPTIVPHHPEKSVLYQLIKSGRMPPSGNKPLNDDEIQRIEEWIRQGAK